MGQCALTSYCVPTHPRSTHVEKYRTDVSRAAAPIGEARRAADVESSHPPLTSQSALSQHTCAGKAPRQHSPPLYSVPPAAQGIGSFPVSGSQSAASAHGASSAVASQKGSFASASATQLHQHVQGSSVGVLTDLANDFARLTLTGSAGVAERSTYSTLSDFLNCFRRGLMFGQRTLLHSSDDVEGEPADLTLHRALTQQSLADHQLALLSLRSALPPAETAVPHRTKTKSVVSAALADSPLTFWFLRPVRIILTVSSGRGSVVLDPAVVQPLASPRPKSTSLSRLVLSVVSSNSHFDDDAQHAPNSFSGSPIFLLEPPGQEGAVPPLSRLSPQYCANTAVVLLPRRTPNPIDPRYMFEADRDVGVDALYHRLDTWVAYTAHSVTKQGERGHQRTVNRHAVDALDVDVMVAFVGAGYACKEPSVQDMAERIERGVAKARLSGVASEPAGLEGPATHVDDVHHCLRYHDHHNSEATRAATLVETAERSLEDVELTVFSPEHECPSGRQTTSSTSPALLQAVAILSSCSQVSVATPVLKPPLHNSQSFTSAGTHLSLSGHHADSATAVSQGGHPRSHRGAVYLSLIGPCADSDLLAWYLTQRHAGRAPCFATLAVHDVLAEYRGAFSAYQSNPNQGAAPQVGWDLLAPLCSSQRSCHVEYFVVPCVPSTMLEGDVDAAAVSVLLNYSGYLFSSIFRHIGQSLATSGCFAASTSTSPAVSYIGGGARKGNRSSVGSHFDEEASADHSASCAPPLSVPLMSNHVAREFERLFVMKENRLMMWLLAQHRDNDTPDPIC